jgi:hypothetical protein
MGELHERGGSGDRVIEEYLRQLEPLLRCAPRKRKRILAEVEEHLRDDGGDAAAIAQFGSPSEVAEHFNALAPAPPARVAAALVMCGALVVFALVQGLEDLLPPAPWPSASAAPSSLRATFAGATIAILVAVGAALMTFAVPRLIRPATAALSCLSLIVCVALLGANAVLRAGYVPGSPSSAGSILLTVLAIGPAAAGLLLLARPRLTSSVRGRLGF